MCASTFAILLGIATGCAPGAPRDLLAPADPRLETRFHPPPSPLAGVRPYQPVEARADWDTAPPPGPGAGAPGGKGAMPGMNGKTMPGMDMKDMDMKDMDMKDMDMPGMPMGTRR